MTDTWDEARKNSLEDAQMISMSILVKTWTFRKGFQWGMFMVLELQDNATWMLLNQRAWSNYSFTCYSISNIKKLENCWTSQPAFMHLDIMNNVKTATIIKTQKHPNVDWILNPTWNFLLHLLCSTLTDWIWLKEYIIQKWKFIIYLPLWPKPYVFYSSV